MHDTEFGAFYTKYSADFFFRKNAVSIHSWIVFFFKTLSEKRPVGAEFFFFEKEVQPPASASYDAHNHLHKNSSRNNRNSTQKINKAKTQLADNRIT